MQRANVPCVHHFMHVYFYQYIVQNVVSPHSSLHPSSVYSTVQYIHSHREPYLQNHNAIVSHSILGMSVAMPSFQDTITDPTNDGKWRKNKCAMDDRP